MGGDANVLVRQEVSITEERQYKPGIAMFDPEEIVELRRLWTDTPTQTRDIAKMFSVQPRTISDLAHRRGWRRDYMRANGLIGKSQNTEDDILLKSLEQTVVPEDNGRAKPKTYPVPKGGFRIGGSNRTAS
jgi:hypothetical protein